jgi:hypothetical protein
LVVSPLFDAIAIGDFDESLVDGVRGENFCMKIRSIALFLVSTLQSPRAAVLAFLRIPSIELPVIFNISNVRCGGGIAKLWE